jgi:hypothetical protein
MHYVAPVRVVAKALEPKTLKLLGLIALLIGARPA